jgi:hypothetical protein
MQSPGHAVTGDRYRSGAEKRILVGHEFVHSLVDDHSRLVYSEFHPDERAATITGFVHGGLPFQASQGIKRDCSTEPHQAATDPIRRPQVKAPRRERTPVTGSSDRNDAPLVGTR